MITEPPAMYVVGVVIGSAITIAAVRTHQNRQTKAQKRLIVESINQHCHLRATDEIVDEETKDEIQDRALELLEEIDLDVVDVGGESDV